MISKGKPASFAKKKKNTIWKKYFLLLLLIALLSVASFVVLWGASSTLHYAAVIIGVIFIAILVVQLRIYNTNLAKLSAGISAENKVSRQIKKYSGDFLINGAILGKIGDCDHIVLGPICVVIETKYGKGQVRVDKGQVFVKNRPIKSNPIQQVKKQAQALSKLHNVKVNAIVCISEGFFTPFAHDGVVLCNAQDLPKVLDRMPTVVSKEKAYSVYTDIKI